MNRPTDPRTTMSRLILALFALPFAVAWLFAFAAQPEPGSLVAPLLGPWAGNAYGHSDCTMASVFPLAAALLVLCGPPLFVLFLRAPRPLARGLLGTALVAWAFAWELAAALSILNTTS